MNDVSYTVLKLTNGDDIICEVDYERYDSEASLSQRVFEIQNPLLMVATRRVEDDGVREGLSLSRWVEPFTEQKYFEIEKSKIILTANASAGLAIYYEKCLESHDQYIHEGPTHEELEEIDEEEYNELLEELDNNEDKIYH